MSWRLSDPEKAARKHLLEAFAHFKVQNFDGANAELEKVGTKAEEGFKACTNIE